MNVNMSGIQTIERKIVKLIGRLKNIPENANATADEKTRQRRELQGPGEKILKPPGHYEMQKHVERKCVGDRDEQVNEPGREIKKRALAFGEKRKPAEQAIAPQGNPSRRESFLVIFLPGGIDVHDVAGEKYLTAHDDVEEKQSDQHDDQSRG